MKKGRITQHVNMKLSHSPVSICIPAYNEEKSIDRTLDGIRAALGNIAERQVDILVLANACTDSTVETIKNWADLNRFRYKAFSIDTELDIKTKYPCIENGLNLTVLETSTPGKPRACNKLHQYAKGDPLIFMDADVTVQPMAFRKLLAAMDENPNALAACGLVFAPPKRKFNTLYTRMAIKMKEFATKSVPYLNGPLYAIKKGAAGEIPEELISDDTYLGMALGVARMVKVQGAIAYQIPPNTLNDYFKRQLRNKLKDLQLKKLYGEKYLSFRADTRDTRSKKERLKCLSTGERIIRIALFPQTWLLKILDKLAKKKADRLFARGVVKWYTMDSTKQG